MFKIKATNKEKFNRSGFGVTSILFAVVTIGLIAAAGWYVHDRQVRKPEPAASTTGSAHSNFYGHEVQQKSCSDVGKIAKVTFPKGHLDGYKCYYAKFAIDGENVGYVSIQQTEAYAKELKEKCGLDCGFSYSPAMQAANAPVKTYIERADGSRESAGGVGGGNTETVVNELTGCGTGASSKLGAMQQAGKLVIDKSGNESKIGVLSDIKDLAFDDSFGNKCLINIKFVQRLDFSEPYLSIKSLSVHYTPKDPSSCNSQSAPSQLAACYSAQAIMRNDLTLCHRLASVQPIGLVYEDQCTNGFAKRRLDAELCNQLNYKDSSALACKDSVKRLKSFFSGKVEAI